MADDFDEITDQAVRESEESYRLFREGDLRFFDRLAPDVEWWTPESLPYGGTHRGESEVVGFLERMGQLFEDAYPDPEEFLPAGDRLVVLGTWRARLKATGDQVEARFAQVHGYRDGRLASFRNYIDSAKILRAVEESPGT